jgi:hypothetical protein
MKKYLLACLMVTLGASAQAQLCLSAADTVYGLNSIVSGGSGQIIGINIHNGGTTLIGSPAASSANANGAGFSAVTGLFYFFNQCAAGTTEFVSYNPLNGNKVSKAIPSGPVPSGPALPTTSTGKIRSGAVNKAGTGYYTIFPGATTAMGYPATKPAFLYYNIGANTWSLITQDFKDVSGNIVTPIQTLNSGDMAFDGNDNLWILCSSSVNYALYRIQAPLPTTYLGAGGFVTVDTMIPVTATPGSVSFTGIAFNSAGKLYLSTGSYSTPPGVAGNNQLYEMSTVGGALTTIATLPNGYGDDLTSCSFPAAVLASGWLDFTASGNSDGTRLSWKINEEQNAAGYDIEYSTDGDHWQTIGHVEKDYSLIGVKQYQYLDKSHLSGRNYYRVAEISINGSRLYSSVRVTENFSADKVYIGPNPAKDILYFYNLGNTGKQLAQVFDKSGRMVYSAVIAQGQQSLPIGNLPRGVYILKFQAPGTDNKSKGYQFIKL